MATISSRTEGRELALRMLFLMDQNEDASLDRIRRQVWNEVGRAEIREFTWSVIDGVRVHREAIDAQIQQIAANWKLNRMAATDRNVLRIGVFEMQHLKTPPAVVINELIEIAKSYGSENSGKFVNGILDKLTTAIENQAADSDSSSAV